MGPKIPHPDSLGIGEVCKDWEVICDLNFLRKA